ncbi:hypothetical protein PR202_gb08372 [Eleusine coracana subsp. coracana]|uniref:Ripening-related protein 6 n=1 Tax=Eleusine coracana subsp. coracana TaxID=191504 RepID=A0AAV5EEZ2_ELECO|nr:hypothetical protein PR202_gb08372 [Eleusine coracana subsp. coracana]
MANIVKQLAALVVVVLAVSSRTAAGPSACDGRFHSNGDKIVALSSGWLRLDGTRRCNRMIRITGPGGRSVLAKVVDECDSSRGCDDNIVDSSAVVWKALGLDTKVGRVRVTWADARSRAPLPGVTAAAAYPAVMTVNGFKRGEEGGGPAACDGHFHSDGDRITALSTRWFANGHRCHKKIRITSVHNGRSVEATVVDECDSSHGCKDNIVDASKAVWEALGLDTNIGEVPVTWSDA